MTHEKGCVIIIAMIVYACCCRGATSRDSLMGRVSALVGGLVARREERQGRSSSRRVAGLIITNFFKVEKQQVLRTD